MTNSNLFLKKATMLILAAGLLFLGSCKKEKDEPAKGSLVFYTFLDSKDYDAIEVFVDKKSVGKITLSHIQRPECGAPTSINVLNVKLSPGKHTWSANQIKGNKVIDEWTERDRTIKAGECDFIKLTE